MSARPCGWCGVATDAADNTCQGCKGITKRINADHRPENALDDRGTWHNRPGGIKVWISWDEGAA